MRNTLVIVAILLLAHIRCFADEKNGAVADFVEELFIGEDFQGLWRQSGFPRHDPYGGYLLHFSFQFDPGDMPLEFIASDRFGEVNRNLAGWSIYKRARDGRWLKLATGVTLSANGFYVDDPSRTLIQLYPKGNFGTLRIERNGWVEEGYYKAPAAFLRSAETA